MERAFLEPVKNVSGEVKFPAGVLYDWPLATWKRIATNLDQDLGEITITKEALAARGVSGSKPTASAGVETGKARQRPRLKE